ncbi:MAG: hypothetical protein ACFFAY_12385 [Promethearchaeota archaeon]
MKLNQKFFGQEHFESGTKERDFCASLHKVKPGMLQYGFSERDVVPELPIERSGVVQVKYNGMLSVILWNVEKERYIAWNPRGRCYFSLGPNKEHPVSKYFDTHLRQNRGIAFIGETYVVRMIQDRAYMTEFSKSMSIIKNPRSLDDVERIRFAVFDYAVVKKSGDLERPGTPLDRFSKLRNDFALPSGCDGGIVHLSDHLTFTDSLQKHQEEVQSFWNEFIKERGFEGLALYLDDGQRYKLKYRDTLDVVILAFRIHERKKKLRPVCDNCEIRFDSFWLRKLVKEGLVKEEEWFKDNLRLKNGTGSWDMYAKDLATCPLCGGSISYTDGPILGAKIALMTEKEEFVDIADGSQIPPSSPILDIIEPLYEEDGYLWIKPEVVIEVSYQDLYIDSIRPVFGFDGSAYKQVDEMKAISLRPYGVTHRPDKTVNPIDLRLEQVSYFVKRTKRIQQLWEEEDALRTMTLDEWIQ